MNVWRLIVRPLSFSLGISLAALAHSAEILPREVLAPGENILAAQPFKASLAESNDFALDPSLAEEAEDTPPHVSLVIPPADSLVRELLTIEVQFDETVQGVDAADLLINGVGAVNVTEFGPGEFVFSFPQPPDGIVSVTWRPDHGITDRASAPHAFADGAWTYTLDSISPARDVLLSEFMADNDRTLNDEDGDHPDWIEIFNSAPTSANLEGWFLTDDINNRVKWRFPNVSILPNGYLLVFASEKNRTNATGRLHTNFKLSDGGEYLALISPATNVVSEFAPAYPKQFRDVSYGRVQGLPNTLGYFTKPTPGGPNADSGPGFAPAVEFSQTSGTFTTSFDLVLSAASPSALILYTLDGNLPTSTSLLYGGPISITNSVQIRARAFQDGLLPGPPRTETFLLLSNNLANFTSDLPVLIMHSLGRGAPNASRQSFAHLSLYEPLHGVTSLARRPALVTRSGIKVRGSSTEGIAKQSFAVEFWDEFNQDEDREILGLPADSDWVLYAPNIFDPVLIHNPFVHQLSREIGRYSPRTRFVEVYLNKSSGPISAANYNGIYVLEEKIKIGRERVAIDKLEPEHVNSPEVTGGYVLKIDRLDPGDRGFSAGGQLMAYVDPKENEIGLPQRDPQEKYIKSYFTNFSRALAGTNWLDPNLGYAAYIDVEAWIDFHVLEVLSGNVDALVLSTYFHKPREGKIVFGPHWDFDRALGSTDGRDANPRIWNTGPFFSYGWWPRLFRDRDFWQKWIDRYQELRRSHLSLNNIHGLVDQLAGEVRKAQPRERQKWRVPNRGGSYQGEVNAMKNWLSNRLDYIDRQLVQPPKLSAEAGLVISGFTLTISGPANAPVYFTLDGSDPRLPQGELSPNALSYTGPIRLDENVRLVARARNLSQRQTGGPPISSPWSGKVAATFVVNPPPLILTELMFHPAPAPAGMTNSPSDFEFLELKNVGNGVLDLLGFRLTNGVEFNFTSATQIKNLSPGQRVLLVKNQAAFLSRYPEATNIAGEFLGSLANGNNRLAMVGPLLEPIFDFKYEDTWQPLADGFGFSLVLGDETTPPDKLGNREGWRLSAKTGGSPGHVDSLAPALPLVLINELLSYPGPSQNDTLELFNPNAQAVDLAGWFLTDDFRQPKRFRLPSGVTIPPRAYLTLESGDFPGRNQSVPSFSRSDDGVYLFSADSAGNLTGLFHGFEFSGSEKGVSFGRYVTSVGAESFVAQTSTTLGETNSGPRVGPIVINEIMYEPAAVTLDNNTSDEFIELRNITARPVPLFDPLHPTNTWRLRGAVDFDFPMNATLPPSGYLVVVGSDPRSDPGALAAFRSRFGLDLSTPIVGPWGGRLGNSGDTIRLFKPEEPQLEPATGLSDTPNVLVEQIAYSNEAPWPTNAAGTGRSLLRREPASYGDDAINWIAAAPNPGDADSDGDGLPDRWEIAAGLNPSSALGDDAERGDPDRDGFTNLEEFLSGTAPLDANSFLELRAAAHTAGAIVLTFTAAPGRSYTVQHRDNLASGFWQALRIVLVPPEGGTLSVIETPTTAARFYRLTVP